MMTKTRLWSALKRFAKWLGTGIAVLAAVFILWFLVDPKAERRLYSAMYSTTMVAMPERPPAKAPEAPGAAKSRPSPFAATLPDPLLPLAGTLKQYKEEALAGNHLAACKLTEHLQMCSNLSYAHAELEKKRAHLATLTFGSPEYLKQAAYLAASKISMVRLEEHCEGIAPAETDQAWRYLLNAAKAGHLPSMVKYVTDPPLHPNQMMQEFEAWQTYRTVAPAMLERAAAAGDIRAIEWLRAQMVGDWPFNGGPLMSPDPQRAVMLSMVLDHFQKSNFTQGPDRRVAALKQQIGEQGVSLATAQADQFVSKTFGDLPAGKNPLPVSAVKECQGITSAVMGLN